MGVLPDWMIERDVRINPRAEGIDRPGVISYGTTSYGYDARVGYKFKIFSPAFGAMGIDPKAFDPKILVETNVTPVTSHDWYRAENQNELTWRCRRCKRETDNPDRTDAYYGQGTFGKCIEPPNHVWIPAHSFALAETIEEFTIPRDCLCIVLGKSTYARTGLIVNVTPGEPEWTGRWTVELSNTTPLPIKVYAGEGIMQCIFLRTDGFRELDNQALRRLLHPGQGRVPPMSKEEMDLHFLATCRRSYADKKGKYQYQNGIQNPIVEGVK